MNHELPLAIIYSNIHMEQRSCKFSVQIGPWGLRKSVSKTVAQVDLHGPSEKIVEQNVAQVDLHGPFEEILGQSVAQATSCEPEIMR